MASASFCNALYSALFASNSACKAAFNCSVSLAPFTTVISDGSYPITSALRLLTDLKPNATESATVALAPEPIATLLSPPL